LAAYKNLALAFIMVWATTGESSDIVDPPAAPQHLAARNTIIIIIVITICFIFEHSLMQKALLTNNQFILKTCAHRRQTIFNHAHRLTNRIFKLMSWLSKILQN